MSDWPFLNRHRIHHVLYRYAVNDGFNGAFSFPLKGEARRVFCIASDGRDMTEAEQKQWGVWQHVSVSFGPESKRTPSWEVMCAVKDLFWEPEDCVIQFHPPKSEYVNYHPGCLHLWRVVGQSQPIPPAIFVGPKESAL